jgi:hypothetical protein
LAGEVADSSAYSQYAVASAAMAACAFSRIRGGTRDGLRAAGGAFVLRAQQ